MFMRIEAGLAAASTIPLNASSMRRVWGPPVERKIRRLVVCIRQEQHLRSR
jgi:hypothetical protein